MTVLRPRTCGDVRAQLHAERAWRITRSDRLTKVMSRDPQTSYAIQREYAEGVVMGLSIALKLLTQISA